MINQTPFLRLHAKAFSAFSIVGAFGFLIDAGILILLTAGLGWNPYLARLLSFGIATLLTWALNRKFTFSPHKLRQSRTLAREYIHYLMVQSLGGGLNLLVYYVLLSALPTLKHVPVIALAFGSATGLLFNFLGARFWIYKSTIN